MNKSTPTKLTAPSDPIRSRRGSHPPPVSPTIKPLRNHVNLALILVCVLTITTALSLNILSSYSFTTSSSLRRITSPPHDTLVVEKYTWVPPDAAPTPLPHYQGAHDTVCRLSRVCVQLRADAVALVLPPALMDAGVRQGEVMRGCLAAMPRVISWDDAQQQHHGGFPGVQDLDLMFAFGSAAAVSSSSSSSVRSVPVGFAEFVLRSGALTDLSELALGNRSENPLPLVYSKYIVRAPDDGQQHYNWSRVLVDGEPSLSDRRNTLKPAVLVSAATKAAEARRTPAWVNAFLRDVFAASATTPVLVAVPELISDEPQMQCFRSVWLPHQSVTAPARFNLTHHSLFVENNLVKERRADFCAPTRVAQVTILNRKGSRVLENVPEIARAVENALYGLFARVSVEQVLFDNLGYAEQVAVMQRTDVLIVAHGAGMANSLFMREGSFVLEVFPFAYTYVGYQGGLKTRFKVDGDFVISRPDYMSYERTISQYCESDCKSGDLQLCLLICDDYKSSFVSLSKKVNMVLVSEHPHNFYFWKESSLLMTDGVSRRALRAQNLNADPDTIQHKISAWLVQLDCDQGVR